MYQAEIIELKNTITELRNSIEGLIGDWLKQKKISVNSETI
jgi:hypothetical protein